MRNYKELEVKTNRT